MERCGRFTLKAERIAHHIELAHGDRRRERQGDASSHRLRLNHHLRHQRHFHSGRDHAGDRAELSTSYRQCGPKMMGRQELIKETFVELQLDLLRVANT